MTSSGSLGRHPASGVIRRSISLGSPISRSILLGPSYTVDPRSGVGAFLCAAGACHRRAARAAPWPSAYSPIRARGSPPAGPIGSSGACPATLQARKRGTPSPSRTKLRPSCRCYHPSLYGGHARDPRGRAGSQPARKRASASSSASCASEQAPKVPASPTCASV